MAKSTQGCWQVVEMLDDTYRICVDGNTYDGIADIHLWQTPEESLANANVMAAAPDLRYALVCLVRLIAGEHSDTGADVEEVAQLVRDALRKAAGDVVADEEE